VSGSCSSIRFENLVATTRRKTVPAQFGAKETPVGHHCVQDCQHFVFRRIFEQVLGASSEGLLLAEGLLPHRQHQNAYGWVIGPQVLGSSHST